MIESSDFQIKTDTCWEDDADLWVDALAQGLDTINDKFSLPAFAAFVGDLSNCNVLDLGCGEGRSSRYFAQTGASVDAVDPSDNMLHHARHHPSQESYPVNYIKASATDLSSLTSNHYDRVLSFMTLMDLPEYPRVLSQVVDVLKPGGSFAFMIRHPCFITPRYRIVGNNMQPRSALQASHYYLSEPYTESWRFPGMDKSKTFHTERFPRTLSTYINNLSRSGLVLQTIDEPVPSDDLCERYPHLKFWQQHAALFFCVSACKSL